MMMVLEERSKSNGKPPTGEVEIAIARLLGHIGFNNQRIAALFGCNQGRINECQNSTNAYDGIEVEWVFKVGKQGIAGS